MLLRHRLPLVALGVLALGGMLGGCAPDPAPTPSPTPAFASDEEAFAAAEEVYRAYNDAVNARNSGLSSPDPQDFLISNALEGDIEAQRYLDSLGVRLEGSIFVKSFAPSIEAHFETSTELTAHVCLDLSATRALDEGGTDVTPVERPSVIAQIVTMRHQEQRFLITDETEGTDESCAP
ncbi:hypothetical protein [Microbacterium sp. GCS4]|uniref:hypothetical protein n=1 Tax=Microbacterium sp. GCS4 TaxID=1692239 RepID=UPI0006825A13|nr:hypothetical protein [Microbacterium sp. GCS4]